MIHLFGFFKKLHKNEKGNYFVEIALAMIIIVLVIAGNISTMVQQGIVPKYQGITSEIGDVPVPMLPGGDTNPSEPSN